MTFRIAPSGADADRGVQVCLSPAHGYAVEDYSTAHAIIGVKRTPLTRKEADAVAAFVAETMTMREQPISDPGRTHHRFGP